MFSFRSDKTGFFVTIILIVLLVAVVVFTIVAAALGWEEHKASLKIAWGTWWVLCIIVVLVRIGVYRWQMLRAESSKAVPEPPAEPLPGDGQVQAADQANQQSDKTSNP